MIKSFADEETRAFWEKGTGGTVPPNIRSVSKRKLQMVDAATQLDDLKVPPGNKLHPLLRERSGQHAIWINHKYRVCFTWKDGHAFDVEITDYHD
ncbi:MAG TPA: type II toxin-antitoxin system RelE/ParE family toxin [Candidatus Angelobacter sp.]|nr:type II toxin-antitoxin system RelE/ParE family toxin [Candidatus Angelobacter sp.]